MKKLLTNNLMSLTIAVALAMVLSLSACGTNEDNSEAKSLYAQGLEIVQLMSELTQSTEYVDFFNGSNEIKSVIQNISTGDYTTPKTVYAISIADENLAAMAALNNLDNASKGLKSFLTQKTLGALMTQLNSRSGVVNLAATSVCTVEKTFVNENVNENVIYLYTYDNAVPVAVTFIVGEDQSIYASGVYIMYDLFPCGSADEIESFFSVFDITVEVTEVFPEK